jgi:uncharacterized cofD-like protein
LLPNLLVNGITEEIKKSKAKVVFIVNLMSKIGQTRGKSQKEIVELVEGYLEKKIDYILLNNGKLPQEAYKRYIEDGEHILGDDLHDGSGRTVIRKDLIGSDPIKKQKGDNLKRSLIRHDSEKLGKELYSLFNRDKSVFVRIFNSLLSHYKD